MINYIVIGICIFLLVAVIYVSAKPIGMGIEARRNKKDFEKDEEKSDSNYEYENNYNNVNNTSLSEEILKLKKLKNDGVLNEEEYKKAKEKLLS